VGVDKIGNMTDPSGSRPGEAADPSVRRITVARFEDADATRAAVVNFNRFVRDPRHADPEFLSHVRHVNIPVQDALLEAWAVFERDLLGAAVWLGIASAPMTKSSWRNLVAIDRVTLISEVTAELIAKDASLLNGFEDRAIELKHVRDRIAAREVVYQPVASDYLVLFELTGPGRGVGDVIPYAELHELLDIALRLIEVLRSSVLEIGGDAAIFEYQTEYSPENAALLDAEVAEARRADG
jgi:hypothetical protein